MLSERIEAILGGFPWIPEDYARVLAKVRAGEKRYGVTWFDGPQRPADIPGQPGSEGSSTAFWIARRDGHLIGYDDSQSHCPALIEWGGSQRRLIRRYAGIDELILAQRSNPTDLRPVVRNDLAIRGMAFGLWHDAGAELVADCILSPGLEAAGLENLLDQMAAGWELILVRDDNDSWLSVRKCEGGIELQDARHGAIGNWRSATRNSALSELAALASCNGGAIAQHFGSMRVPKSACGIAHD